MRSSKADHIQVPIQLHLNNDTEFLSQLLKTNSQIQQQVGEESDSSPESDLNCSDIVENSDGEKTGKKESERSDETNETAPDNLAVQQLINSQILSQLQTISQRLDKIEQTRGEKTNDPKKIKFCKNRQSGTDSQKLLAQIWAKHPPLQIQLSNKSCHRMWNNFHS